MRLSAGFFLFATMAATAAFAQPAYKIEAPGASPELRDLLAEISLSRTASANQTEDAQELFAAAKADYARLLGALYDQGHYGGVISIRVDGREVSAIAPMDAPQKIGRVDIRVDAGPQFHFSRAAVGPLAPETQIPSGFAPREIARSGLVGEAANAAVSGWRAAGHAKPHVAEQKIIADHRNQTLDATLTLKPGPLSWFGDLHLSGNKRLRSQRLAEIAGYPNGKRFTPERLDAVRARLRRTGIFTSATVTEAEQLRHGNLLDAHLTVVEAKPRRLGFGAELTSSDGATVSVYWLHRNLLGGGERLRFDAEISGLGGGTGGIDYTLATRLDRPATFTPDTSAFVEAKLTKEDTDDYVQDGFTFGVGLKHIFNDRLSGDVALRYEWSRVRDPGGERLFRLMSLPVGLTWDNRDTPADATRGYYGQVQLTPFHGFGATGSGLRLMGDFRSYLAFGGNDRFVLAGRMQIGGVFGANLAQTPRDYLFYSGGGGTVRGQSYQSLGVNVLRAGTQRSGGTRFIGLSGELRTSLTPKIGVVAFYDAGFISADDFFGGSGDWHSGAGLGLRYKTPIGPIRLDVAAPVGGSRGDGAQIYIGIGQAF